MKTAQTIAQQQASQAETATGQKPTKKKYRSSPAQLANLVAPWTSETRPKSPGRPRDTAAELARKVIENNEEQIYKGLAAKAMGGDAYAFSVLADRGYGKLKQGIVHTGDEDGGPLQALIEVKFVKPEGD